MKMPNYLFNDSFSRYARQGVNAYSAPVYAKAEKLKGKLEYTSKRILSRQGEEVSISAVLFVPSTQTLSVGDKITGGSLDYQIIEVQPQGSHTEALLQLIAT